MKVSRGARAIRRAPFVLDDCSHSVFLGRVLEVEASKILARFDDEACDLLWAPQISALLWVRGAKKASPSRDFPEEMGDIFGAWSGRDATTIRAISFSTKRLRWESFGRAHRVDYWSDKKGDEAEYTHELGKNVRFYRGSCGRSEVWALSGGDLRVTSRGIEG